MASPEPAEDAPETGDLKKKLIRGGIAVAVLLVLAASLIALLPGLDGVRSAIAGASTSWVVAAAGIQLAGVAGAVLFVQLLFADEPRRLTWKMGGAQLAADAVMPTAGATAVGFWTLSSVGWKLQRFAERTAVQLIAPAAPNFLLIIVFGLGMGIGLFAGPSEWWLTWLPAVLTALVVLVALVAGHWGHRLAARTHRRWLQQALHVLATGITGTVEILRRRDWRVLGTWVEVLAAIAALWACLIAVGNHLPFATVGMAFLIGQIAQVIPIPGGIGAIDAGITGALVLYGGETSDATGAVVISHALALLLPLLAGGVPSRSYRARSNGNATARGILRRNVH